MSRKKTTESSSKLSRRDFARNAALLAAAATVPVGLSVSTTAQTPAKLSPEAEAQYQTIIAKYGDRLSSDQKADIRRLIGDGQKSAATVRAFPLDNADESANMFRVTESKKR